jgi:hypothetical protein
MPFQRQSPGQTPPFLQTHGVKVVEVAKEVVGCRNHPGSVPGVERRHWRQRASCKICCKTPYNAGARRSRWGKCEPVLNSNPARWHMLEHAGVGVKPSSKRLRTPVCRVPSKLSSGVTKGVGERHNAPAILSFCSNLCSNPGADAGSPWHCLTPWIDRPEFSRHAVAVSGRPGDRSPLPQTFCTQPPLDRITSSKRPLIDRQGRSSVAISVATEEGCPGSCVRAAVQTEPSQAAAMSKRRVTSIPLLGPRSFTKKVNRADGHCASGPVRSLTCGRSFEAVTSAWCGRVLPAHTGCGSAQRSEYPSVPASARRLVDGQLTEPQ